MAEHLVSLSVVWSDVDLLEVEISASFRGWSAIDRAYAARSDLTGFADSLDRVVQGDTEAELSVGQPNLGYASCRIFEYGGPRHLAMDVVVGSGETGRRHDHGRECRLSVPIERGQLTAFAQTLRLITREERGRAALLLLPDWP
jgi:hypothetical protein